MLRNDILELMEKLRLRGMQAVYDEVLSNGRKRKSTPEKVIFEMLKAEARVSLDKKAEIALSVKPRDRIKAILRFINTPYIDIPVKSCSLSEDTPLAERINYTDRSIIFEIGWELNPASLVALGLRYNPGDDVVFKDRYCEDITSLDGKPSFAIGATFTVDMRALAGAR